MSRIGVESKTQGPSRTHDAFKLGDYTEPRRRLDLEARRTYPFSARLLLQTIFMSDTAFTPKDHDVTVIKSILH